MVLRPYRWRLLKPLVSTVQVHNIPIGYRNKLVAEDICEAIGLVDCSTKASESEGGSFIHVRVILDVFQPICQGRIIKLEDGEKKLG